MKAMRVLVTVWAMLVSVPFTVVQADFVDINVANWEVFGGFGDAQNSEFRFNIGNGSAVDGFEWINLDFDSEGASWRSELVLSVNNVDGSLFTDFIPSTDDSPGNYFGSGAWNATDGFGAPFVVGDGEVWVTMYDTFQDAGRNAFVNGGTLRVNFTAVPEPTSALVLGAAAAGLCFVRRRRA